ncbi:MAG TPA: hypothetical protein VEL72_05010, partial [Ktedonobacteraceae bacterium]|nr:hypothetical protein [Ktedonobacteraceae bacterium]
KRIDESVNRMSHNCSWESELDPFRLLSLSCFVHAPLLRYTRQRATSSDSTYFGDWQSRVDPHTGTSDRFTSGGEEEVGRWETGNLAYPPMR